MNYLDEMDDENTIEYIIENDENQKEQAMPSDVSLIYEHVLKWMYTREGHKYRSWAETIFQNSYRLVYGVMNRKFKLSLYDMQNIYHKIRKKILTSSEFNYLKITASMISEDIPELYNIDYLYKDDLLFDFVIETSYDKYSNINDLIHYYNKYREKRNLNKAKNSKDRNLYNGDGNYKQEY